MSKHGGGGFFVAGAAGGGAGGSVTSNEASAISAQAASAIDVVSNAVSVVSQAVSALSQQNSVEHAALSVRVDTVSQQASVLSQAVSIISQQVSVLSQTVSVHSQRWSTLAGGAVSTYLRKNAAGDFAWEWGSVTAGGTGSVTSAQRDVLSQGISVLSVQAALVDGTDTEQIWEKVFPGTNTSIVLLAGGKAIEVSALPASVTSAELDTVSTAASNALSVANAASNAASIVSTAASNALSVANAASNAASIVSTAASNALSVANAASNAASVVSQAVSVLSQATSVADAALSVRIDTQSQSISVISQQVSALSQAHSALSQVVSVISTTLSNLGSVVSVTHSNTLSVHSQAISVISQQVSILSQTVSVHSQRWSTLGGGAISTYLRKTGAGDFAWEWGSVTAAGVGSVTSAQRDVLSADLSRVDGIHTEQIWEKIFPGTNTSIILLAGGRAIEISSTGGGAASVTSAELGAISWKISGVTSVQGVQSAFNQIASVISNSFSAGDVVSNKVSVLSDRVGRIARLAAEATVSAATLTDVSGMSLAVSAAAHYAFDAVMMYSTSVAQPVAWGMTFPAMTQAGGRVEQQLCVSTSAPGQSIVNVANGWWQTGGSGSILLSVASPGVAGQHPVIFHGMFLVSTAGTLQMQAKASTGTGRIVLLAGSYMRLAKLN